MQQDFIGSSKKPERVRGRLSKWRRSRQPLVRYFEALPSIALYQLVSRALLWIALMLCYRVVVWLLALAGHVAVSTGDYFWAFKTWEGWAIAAFGLAALFVLTTFDIAVNVLYAARTLSPEAPRKSMVHILQDACTSVRAFLTPTGIGFVLAVALLSPLVGVGTSSTLTQNIQIPSFIIDPILQTPAYLASYVLIFVALGVFFFFHSFTMHEVLIGRKKPREALAASRALVRANWKRYLPRLLYVTLALSVVVLLLAVAAIVIPQLVALALNAGQTGYTTAAVFAALLSIAIQWAAQMLALPLETLELTRLWMTYRQDPELPEVVVPAASRRTKLQGLALIGTFLLVSGALSYALALDFDELFPAESHTNIIAHRCGGNLAPENSVAGIFAAADKGAAGSETDVQRTADGRYIINHDETFERLYHNAHTASELSFAQVRSLRNAAGQPPATLEELLDAAQKTGIKLYIELKGPTADSKMADDVVSMVEKRNMTGQVAVISLKYWLLVHIEATHPEIETGYLYFASFGDPSAFKVDDLIIEEGLATHDYLAQIHSTGKRAIVWTVNSAEGLERFLASEADAIITDEVDNAMFVKDTMPNRSPYERVYDILAWP